MDEAGGSVMHDLSGSGLDGSIGSAVVVGGGTYRFPGWSQNVDPYGRLAGTVPPDAGAVEIVDPSDLLDRGARLVRGDAAPPVGPDRWGTSARSARHVVQRRPEGARRRSRRLLEARARWQRLGLRPAALGALRRTAIRSRGECGPRRRRPMAHGDRRATRRSVRPHGGRPDDDNVGHARRWHPPDRHLQRRDDRRQETRLVGSRGTPSQARSTPWRSSPETSPRGPGRDRTCDRGVMSRILVAPDGALTVPQGPSAGTSSPGVPDRPGQCPPQMG